MSGRGELKVTFIPRMLLENGEFYYPRELNLNEERRVKEIMEGIFYPYSEHLFKYSYNTLDNLITVTVSVDSKEISNILQDLEYGGEGIGQDTWAEGDVEIESGVEFIPELYSSAYTPY